MASERSNLLVDGIADVLKVVGIVCPIEIGLAYPPRFLVAKKLFSKDVPFARGPKTIECGIAGGAVVGCKLIVAPGVNGKDNVRLVLADDMGQPCAQCQR